MLRARCPLGRWGGRSRRRRRSGRWRKRRRSRRWRWDGRCERRRGGRWWRGGGADGQVPARGGFLLIST